MKKIFVILVVVIGFGIDAGAQVCKISGSNDNVEVMSCYIVGNQVVVNVSNDSNDIMANVTVSVTVKYSSANGTNCGTIEIPLNGKGLANAGKYTEIKIDIPVKNGYKPCEVTPKSITGTKCL